MDADERIRSVKVMAHVVYALQALGFFNGITWIVAIIIDYVKKDDASGTWLESHYRWQIRTFWFGLLWLAIASGVGVIGFFGGALLGYLSGNPDAVAVGAVGGGLLFAIVGGGVIGLAGTIWLIYRIVRGWINLAENRPLPLPSGT